MFDDGLDDDRRKPIAGLPGSALQRLDVVKWNGAKQIAGRLGDPPGVARPIVPTEIPASDNEVAIGVSARDPNRRRHSFGAALEKLHQLGAWNVIAQSLRELHFTHVRKATDVPVED